MTSPKTYDGSCFCGAVEFTVTGAPVSMGYCHCNSCRHWSAAPLIPSPCGSQKTLELRGEKKILGPLAKRRKAIASGARHAAVTSLRIHPELGLIDVYAAAIPGVPFIPGLHVNYSETKLPIGTVFFKLKDFPHGFGGSGIEVVE